MIIVTISYYGPPDFELQLGSGDLGPRLIFRATAAAPSRAARDGPPLRAVDGGVGGAPRRQM